MGTGIGVEKMLIAINNHAELGAPVADVIVANHIMAEEAQCAADGIADHCRTNVAHMHWLGHIGAGIIDDECLGFFKQAVMPGCLSCTVRAERAVQQDTHDVNGRLTQTRLATGAFLRKDR